MSVLPLKFGVLDERLSTIRYRSSCEQAPCQSYLMSLLLEIGSGSRLMYSPSAGAVFIHCLSSFILHLVRGHVDSTRCVLGGEM